MRAVAPRGISISSNAVRGGCLPSPVGEGVRGLFPRSACVGPNVHELRTLPRARELLDGVARPRSKLWMG
eukprot:12369494-Alexandrium_andersonii.AAC.1